MTIKQQFTNSEKEDNTFEGLKVLVIGTGSIGQRHIRNLISLRVDVYAFSYRGKNLESEFFNKIQMVSSWKDALKNNFDGVIICNSTEKHVEVAIELAKHGINFFIEKPLSSNFKFINDLSLSIYKKKLIVESGFMLRFHPNIIWIYEKLRSGDLGEIMHMRASVGQWLPDWRPGVDYRQGYGAFREQGGGVIFDLIHELDLIQWLIGPVVDVSAMKRSVSSLEIETEAIAEIILRMKSGILANVHLDYVRPGYARNMELVCLHGVLTWDYIKGEVYLEHSGEKPILVNQVAKNFERNIMFKLHMIHFLKRLKDPNLAPASSYFDAVEALRIAIASHIASDERRNICPIDINSFSFS